MAQTLSALGFNEVITYSLLSQEAVQKIRFEGQDAVSLENPLSREQEVLRPSLTWGLLNVLARNLNWEIPSVPFLKSGIALAKTANSGSWA